MSNLIGQALGPYRILEQIGRGGMATVYKAYHPAMDRHVAVKVLPAHFMQDPNFVVRFEREARTIARLEHPHILPVHDYGEAPEGTTYLVMRYIEAGTLSSRLKQGPLPLTEVLNLFSQIGDALAYAHEQGVIHRDLKPSNVLVDPRGQAFLTDFGLAKMVEGDSNLTGSLIVGTPAYMAPEQGKGQPADKRSDIYSMGIILYEMVTGQTPFEAETPMAVIIKHMTEALPLPSQVNPQLPPAVERVILKALAKEPDDRYQNVTDMIKALQEAVTLSPTLISTPDATMISEKKGLPLPAQPKATSRRPAWLMPVVVGAVVLLLILVAGGILARRLNRSFLRNRDEAPAAAAPIEEDSAEAAPAQIEPLPETEEEAEAAPVSAAEVPSAAASASSPWSQFSNTKQVNAITSQGDTLWAGTNGGLVAWNRSDGSYYKYTTLDGLPDHNIFTLLVASDGNLWAGTEGGGVVRFDGQDWTTFRVEDGLTGDEVASLFETREGVLLAGTVYGEEDISQFQGDHWTVADLPPLPVDAPRPVAFAQDESGHLAIGLSDEGGLLYLEDDQWQHVTTDQGLPSNTILGLAYDTAGNLWVATAEIGGVGTFKEGTFTPASELSEIWGTSLYAAPDGTLWLGTSYAGLWHLEEQGWRRYSNDEKLLDSEIIALHQDENGLLWLGTLDDGLISLEGETSKVWTIENEPLFNSAQQILETGDGQLWFVEQYGGDQVVVYTPDTDTWDTFEAPGHAQALALGPEGQLWVGTNEGLWQVADDGTKQLFTTEDGLPGNNITALTFGEDEDLWVGTDAGLVVYSSDDDVVMWRDFTDYIPSPQVSTLYADPEGRVWIGTAATEDRPAGVAWGEEGVINEMWLAGDDLPEALQPVEDSVAGHPFPVGTGYITAFALDSEENLWVGTWNGGLWEFTPDTGEWRVLDSEEGAPSSNVLTIAADSEGAVWFGTWFDNLWGFHPAEGWWQHTAEDGLPGDAIFASTIDEESNLWIATESGLARNKLK
jgi:serine/threonine protein kinase/ligand-binding sensor domain-containing protein